MRRMAVARLAAVLILAAQVLVAPAVGGPGGAAHAAGSPSGGAIPWHPHLGVVFAAGLGASVDLADGHADISAADLNIRFVGTPYPMVHTWDSAAAAAGLATVAGRGWNTNFTASMAGAPGSTVTYTDVAGTQWPFTFSAGAYQAPPGTAWTLTASGSGYTLADILSGAVSSFDASGRLLSAANSYGDALGVTYAANLPTVWGSAALTTSGGLLATAANGGGSQRMTQSAQYAYTGGRLTALTRAPGRPEAISYSFAYTGNLLTTLTTGAGHAWTLGWTGSQLTTITSPSSGTVGQPDYTPAITTQISYAAGQTTVVRGYGSPQPITTTYTLDAAGEATAVADALGDTARASYGADHELLTAQDADGNTTTNHYTYINGGMAALLNETDLPAIAPNYPGSTPVAPVTTYLHDPATYDLLEADSNAGASARYTYDGHHGVLSAAVLIGATTAGGATSYHWRGSLDSYDGFGERLTHIDGRGVSVPDTTSFAAAPAVAANAQAANYTTTWTYNGGLASVSTPPIDSSVGHKAAVTYFNHGLGLGAGGEVPNTTSANQHYLFNTTTTYTYDALGRLVATTLPPLTLWGGPNQQPAQTTSYDGDGNAVRQVDGAGVASTSSYDPLQRLVRSAKPSGITTMGYTGVLHTSTSDGLQQATTFAYDAAGRLASSTDAAGGFVGYGYDANGNATTITRGDGHTATSTETRVYDALNRVVSDTISGPAGPSVTTATSYDLAGRVVRVAHPNGTTSFTIYNLAGQATARELDNGYPNTPAGTGRETMAYDAAGNLLSHTDRDGRVTSYSVDGANRVTQVTDTQGGSTQTTTNTYDLDGNLVSSVLSGPGQSDAYSAGYNQADWMDSASGGGVVSTYSRDGAARTRVLGQPNGTITLAYGLDNAGRATSISAQEGSTAYPTTFAYNANSLPTSWTEFNALVHSASYDAANRVTQVQDAQAGTIGTWQYAYDPVGTTSTITTTVGSASVLGLTHDDLNRLIGTSGASGASWTYDGRGNITTVTTGAGLATYAYSAGNLDQLSSVSRPGQPTVSYGYDGEGHATSITPAGSAATALGYDPRGRLASVTLGDGTLVKMGYNAAGQRASYTVTPPGRPTPTISEGFAYRGGQISQAVVISGTTAYTDTYVYAPQGTPITLARNFGGPSSVYYWYIVDGRGNVVGLKDRFRRRVATYAYDLWGVPTASSETVAQPLRYAGYWYDRELGWYWLSVREYDPALERFLAPDPSEQEGLFSYVYAADDPVDATDPSGLLATCDSKRGGCGNSCAAGQQLYTEAGFEPFCALSAQGAAAMAAETQADLNAPKLHRDMSVCGILTSLGLPCMDGNFGLNGTGWGDAIAAAEAAGTSFSSEALANYVDACSSTGTCDPNFILNANLSDNAYAVDPKINRSAGPGDCISGEWGVIASKNYAGGFYFFAAVDSHIGPIALAVGQVTWASGGGRWSGKTDQHYDSSAFGTHVDITNIFSGPDRAMPGQLTLFRLYVSFTTDWGIFFEGGDGSTYCDGVGIVLKIQL